MDPAEKTRFGPSKRLRCESWRTSSKRAKKSLRTHLLSQWRLPLSKWPSTKASRVYKALLRIGWTVKRSSSGSHTQLSHPTKGESWAFHDSAEIGPNMLARIAKHTGLKPEDL